MLHHDSMRHDSMMLLSIKWNHGQTIISFSFTNILINKYCGKKRRAVIYDARRFYFVTCVSYGSLKFEQEEACDMQVCLKSLVPIPSDCKQPSILIYICL